LKRGPKKNKLIHHKHIYDPIGKSHNIVEFGTGTLLHGLFLGFAVAIGTVLAHIIIKKYFPNAPVPTH
jgi:hypothetical protein